MLNLAEEILLIALDDNTGELLPMPVRSLDIALAGALLMELVFKEHVTVTEAGVHVDKPSLTGDSMLDHALEHIPEAEEGALLPTELVLKEIAGPKNSLKNMLCEILVGKNILRQEDEKHFFNLFTRSSYPMVDASQEYAARDHIRKVVLDESVKPKPRDIVIVTLVSTCKLGKDVFSEEELEAARPRIESIKDMDILGRVLADAVSEVQQSIAQIISLSGM